MKKIFLLSIIAALSLFSRSAMAATTYLANGDLRGAVNSAADGDVIILTGDTYSWATLLNNYTKSITIKASPTLTARPVVTFSSTAGAFIKCTPAALKTITFDGIDFNGAGIATGLITPAAASGGDLALNINNCVVRNIVTAAVLNYTAQATLTAGYSNLTVTNSRFIGMPFLTATVGGKTATPKMSLFRNCYFSTYQATGSNMYTNGGGTGCDVTFDHCTINKGPASTKRVFNIGTGSVSIVKNCIIANEAAGTSGVALLNANAASTNNTFYLCIGTLSTRFPNMGTYTDTADPGIPTLPAVGSLTASDADYFTSSGKGYYNNTVLTKSVTTLSGFAYEVGSGPSAAKTFTLSGADLFNKITVTAPSNYEVCKTVGGTYTSSISFLPTLGVTADSTVYVRLVAGLSAASYNGDITLSSTNLTTQTVTLTGSVSAGGTPAFTTSVGSLSGFNYIYAQGPSSEQSFTVSGSNLTANVAIAAPTDYEVSLTSGSGFGASASIPFGSGTLTTVPVYVRLKAGLNGGSYNTENIALTSSGATAQNVTCSGTVTPPTVTITPTSLTSFFALAGSATPSTEKTFTVGGSNLAGNITVTPSTNYEISTGTGVSFSATNPITLTPSSGTVSTTTIYVRLKGSLATASYNENITVATAGASDATVACSGVVATPVVKVGTSAGADNKFSLASLTYTYGVGPSVSQTGMFVSGDYLQGDVTVTAPTGFEVSKDNSTFADAVTFTMSNQTVSGQIWNRLKAGLNTDSYSGNVVYSSTGAANRNVAAAGSVTGGPQLTAGSLIGLTANHSYAGNGPSAVRAFLLTGANLASDVTVTPSANFEVSLVRASGYSSSPITSIQADATAGDSIYVRLKGGLAPGTYAGEVITLSATNANNKTVAVSGTVTSLLTRSVTSITASYAGYGPSPIQTVNVAGVNVTGDVTVTAPVSGNYEISLTTGPSFSAQSSIVLTQSGGAVASTPIYVRLKSLLALGSYSGETMTISSPGATAATVTCNGTVTSSVMKSVTSIITGLDYTVGNGPSAEQTFTVYGENLAGDIVITPSSTDFEISTTSGSGFASTPLTLTHTSGSVALTTIYVRSTSGKSTATYNGSLAVASTGLSDQTITLQSVVDVTVGLNGVTNTFNTYTANGSLSVSGVKSGSVVEVFNSLGQRVIQTLATEGVNRIALPSTGIYIVKVANSTRKVSLK